MGFIYSQFFVTPTYPTKSFAGQTVIVTGSNAGLGKEAVRHVARLGASKVIIAVRNTKAGEEARSDIISTTQVNPSTIEVWSLDLSSYDSVKTFADRATRDLERIDALVENAGISTSEYKQVEGHESTITVNVISTFLLALLLLPKLEQTAKDFNVQPRLTIVSSETHAWTKFPEKNSKGSIFQELDSPKTPNMSERYMTSKLLEILVIRHIAPQMKDSKVILNYVNPGWCHSQLIKDKGFLLGILMAIMCRTTEVGSRNLVVAASAGPETHGKYMSDTKVDEGYLSSFVKSDDGALCGKKLWEELKEILEGIQKGVTRDY